MTTYKLRIAFVAVLLLAGCSTSSPPLQTPFSVLNEGDAIEFPLVIHDEKYYEFDLHFRTTDSNAARLIPLLGKAGVRTADRGSPLRVHIKIRNLEEQGNKLIFEKVANGLQWNSTSAIGHNKLIAYVKLPKGKYSISLRNLLPAPQFREWPAFIEVGEDIREGAFKDY